MQIVVEACTSLANPCWTALSTNTVENGSSAFEDAEAANYAARFYRLGEVRVSGRRVVPMPE